MNLEIKKLNFSYNDDLTLFNNFSLSVRSERIISFVGPSGCGKSTLLRLISGLLKPQSGLITIDQVSSNKYRERGNLGIVFQHPDLLPWLSIEDNVALKFQINKEKKNSEIIEKILNDFGILEWKDSYPHQLSGGMQQRVALARAIVSNPKLFLFDEAFSQLDELLRFKLLFYVRDYVNKNSANVILITHDISEAVIVSDKIFIFSKPPITTLKGIEIPIENTRTLETSESATFFQCVNEVRKNLNGVESSDVIQNI